MPNKSKLFLFVLFQKQSLLLQFNHFCDLSIDFYFILEFDFIFRSRNPHIIFWCIFCIYLHFLWDTFHGNYAHISLSQILLIQCLGCTLCCLKADDISRKHPKIGTLGVCFCCNTAGIVPQTLWSSVFCWFHKLILVFGSFLKFQSSIQQQSF